MKQLFRFLRTNLWKNKYIMYYMLYNIDIEDLLYEEYKLWKTLYKKIILPSLKIIWQKFHNYQNLTQHKKILISLF